MGKLLTLIDIFRKGCSVADAAQAKNKAALVGALSVLLYAAGKLAKEFGYDIGITPELAQDIATGLGAVAGLFVTFATSDKVGILPAKPPAGSQADREAP